MQHKISTAILAIILATTMMTSSTLTLTRAFAQDPFTEFFEGITGGGNESTTEGNESEVTTQECPPVCGTVDVPIAETPNGTVPSEGTAENVTEGGVVTPGPAVCPEPPVVVLPPEGNATNENVTTEGPVPFPPQNESGVPPIVTEPPVEETPAENVTMAVDENVTVVEPPIVVVPDGNETTGENGTVVLPPDVPVITPGENSTEEVIEAIENQTEAVENATESAENVTETPEEETGTVTEVIQIELTKEIGAGFLTLLQVGQFIPSVTAEEVESLQTAAVALGNALTSAIEASGGISTVIDQSNVGSGDQSNTATVNQGLYGEDSTAAFYDVGHRRAR